MAPSTHTISPVSLAAVTHHRAPDQHWTVTLGAMTVAQFTDRGEAEQLADRLNAAKTVGDSFDPTTSHSAARGTPLPIPRPGPRCTGLQLTK